MQKKYTVQQIKHNDGIVVRINNLEEDKEYLRKCGFLNKGTVPTRNYPIGRRKGMHANLSFYTRARGKYTIIDLDQIIDKVTLSIKIPKDVLHKRF